MTSSPSPPPSPCEQILSYFHVPEKYDTVTSVRGKKLSQIESDDLEKEISDLFEQQIAGMNAKKMQFYEKYRMQQYYFRKKFICSVWMRGFCFFRTSDCLHAHGVNDLIYSRGDLSYDAQTHYERVDIKQLAHNLNYIPLYEFSRRYNVQDNNSPNEVPYTLDAINSDRTIRTVIREHTRAKLFEDFFLLLRRTYDDIFITEGFIVNEFSRIGVGSDALGFGIKVGRIGNYLTRHLCYVAKAVLPCSLTLQTSFFVVKDQQMCLHTYFKEKILQALENMKENEEEFTEPNIKQQVRMIQGSEYAPSFEVYLVKENMCLFRYFKFYAITDMKFFERCLAYVQTNGKTKIEEGSEEEVFEVENFKNVIQFDCCSEDSEKTKRKNRLLEEYLAAVFPTSKKKLCRYWLRGLCIFTPEQCQFSHGIRDLKYEAYDEHVEDADYTDFAKQKPLWKERSYVSLFHEQNILLGQGLINRIATLEELDQDKELREGIREKMQNNAMEEFLERIWECYGKNIMLTRSMVSREFGRVGFFQIGYTLKHQMIIDVISQRKSFLQTTILPPLLSPTQVVLPFPSYTEVLTSYGDVLLNIFLKTAEELSNKRTGCLDDYERVVVESNHSGYFQIQ